VPKNKNETKKPGLLSQKLKTQLRENNIINNCASTNKLHHLCLPGLRKSATQIIKGYYPWRRPRWKLGLCYNRNSCYYRPIYTFLFCKVVDKARRAIAKSYQKTHFKQRINDR
jgi:hypothetical protein